MPNIGVLHTGLNPDGRQYVSVGRSDLESGVVGDARELGRDPGSRERRPAVLLR